MVYESRIRTGLEDTGKNGLITNRAMLSILENVGGYQSDEVRIWFIRYREKRC